ncbi:MAG TPA: hypothetical protein VE243_01510 [Candidatus Acidoferrum sp.]|nr:hypothetical protein [Candidatus Acidoferrum sp.]
MRPIFLAGLVAILALAGCADVDQDISHLQQEQEAISAATKKIKVVSGANVKGNPPYTTPGSVQGYCFNLPNSTQGQVIHGDCIRAAYRKYPDQVDAIVKTSIWYIADDAYGPAEPYTENGYFECGGTAVHFTSLSAPTPAPAR